MDEETLQIFAVKESPLVEASQHDRERMDGELAILQGLCHRHVIGYLGHEFTETHLMLQLEYATGGSIASMLAEFGPLSKSVLRIATAGVIEGLDYLHTLSTPVVHRDVKGANILVTQDFVVKLADFGCSKRDALTTSFTTIGSVPWMAPEVINQKVGYGRSADIWSLGCTVLEMATAEKPWGRGAFDNLMFALHHIGSSGATPPVPDNVPSSCRELIQACTQIAPEQRPDAGELLHHPFLRKGGR